MQSLDQYYFENIKSVVAIVSVSTSIAVNQPSSSKTGTPTTDDLLRVAHELGTSWKMLGRTLKIPEPELEHIEVDNPQDQFERCYSVLKRWTEVFGSAATYECLARALQHPMVGRGKLAEKYCGVCRDSHQGRQCMWDI